MVTGQKNIFVGKNKKTNLDPFLTTYTTIYSKWVTNLSASTKSARRKQKRKVYLWVRQRVLRYDIKSMSHERNKKLKWTSLKLKIF